MDVPTIPTQLIRRARLQRRLSQEKLAEVMTKARDLALPGNGYNPYTTHQVWKIEAGRCAVRFGDENEPLFWLLRVLEMPFSSLLGER